MIDLDSAREKREAARRESQSEGPKVKFGGEEHSLAPEMPFEVLECLKRMSDPSSSVGALYDITRILLGEHHAAFLALSPKPSLEDVKVLVEGLLEEYGVDSPLE